MATLNFPDDPTTGDVYTDSNSGFSYEWNGTVWISTDPSTASNIREIDNISSSFNGSTTAFTLQVAGVNVEPANVQQLIISVGGVMQNAGDDYTVSGSTLTFTTAPTSGLTFFGTLLGTALSLNTVADGTVGSSSLKTEDFTIGGSGNTVTIPGNLTVQGTETIINVDELNIQDKTIGIASTNAPTATTQDGAGAIIYGETHINILYDVDKAALGISTAVNVSGFVTATRAQVGTGVTINNTGIDIGIGGVGVVTTGNVTGASATITSAVVGTGVTINNTGIDAGIGAGIVTARQLYLLGMDYDGSNLDLLDNKQIRLGTGNDLTLKADGSNSAVVHSGDGDLIIKTDDTGEDVILQGKDAVVVRSNGNNERLKVTSGGGFQFSNGLFDEKVNITAGKLSDNTNIDLANGMVHYFTTEETTTATPNIRIDSSNTLQDAMDTGDTCTVTLITTADATGYSANLTIDGNAVTEEWVGGEAPSAGGDDGLDIYSYTIICIGTGTGDSGFKVIANVTNASN